MPQPPSAPPSRRANSVDGPAGRRDSGEVRARARRRAGADRDPQAGSPPDRRLYINSLEKGLAVLGAFDEATPACTIAELAQRTGLGRSATQRVVYTLDRLGYLRRDPVSRRLVLTPKVLSLGYAFLQTDAAAGLAARFLSEIAGACEEAVSLSELVDTNIIVVSRVPSRHVFTLNIVQGMQFPAFCSAPGRAMLALMPTAAAADIIDRSDLQRITPHTIVARGQLITELDRVRAQGYALAKEEIYLGSLSVAVPVPRQEGMPLAAINVFCPVARWPAKRVRQVLVPLLQRCARDMVALYPPPGPIRIVPAGVR